MRSLNRAVADLGVGRVLYAFQRIFKLITCRLLGSFPMLAAGASMCQQLGT